MCNIPAKKKGYLYLCVSVIIIFVTINEIFNVKDDKMEKEEDSDYFHSLRLRSERLKHSCSHLSSNGKSLIANTKYLSTNLYWFGKEDIVYCPVFKSASSTWIENFIQLCSANKSILSRAKQRHRGNLIEQLKYIGAIQPTEKIWYTYLDEHRLPQNLIGFMVVRHPFERLVSAYRDKLERMNLFYYEKYGKKIVYRFRDMAVKTLGEDFFSKSNSYGTLLNVSQDDRPNASLPSFWEFVQSVIIKLNMDEHWKPIYEHCSVCHPIQLHVHPYILKFENLKEEGPAFLRYFGWEHKINKSTKLNVNNYSDMSSAEITQLYFSILSKDEIRKLYSVYEYDFLLFDYTFKIGDLSVP